MLRTDYLTWTLSWKRLSCSIMIQVKNPNHFESINWKFAFSTYYSNLVFGRPPFLSCLITYFNLLILCMWLQIINKVKVTHQDEGHTKVKVKYLHPFRFYVVHTLCKWLVCIQLNAFLFKFENSVLYDVNTYYIWFSSSQISTCLVDVIITLFSRCLIHLILAHPYLSLLGLSSLNVYVS